MILVLCNAPIAFAGSGVFLHSSCDSSAVENLTLVCGDASCLLRVLKSLTTGFGAIEVELKSAKNNVIA